MPTAPSPKRAEAKSMYLASGGKEKLRIIAEKIGVSEGTLRGWKAKDHWADEMNGTLRKNERNAPKKRGAPKGNKNAVGNCGGAPAGEKHGGYVHGAYAGVYRDVLTDDECSMMENPADNEEALLIEQINLLSIREVRLLKSVKLYKERAEKEKNGMVATSAKKTVISENTANKKTYYKLEKVGTVEQTEVTTTNAISILLKLENELTRVQRAKNKAIESLSNLRITRLKMGLDGDDQLRKAKELLGGIESAF